MTTIVITHDLSQIGPKDFVYVLKDGRVVEQGFRSDLELVVPSYKGQGEFRKMMESQRETGGFLPEKQFVTTSSQNLGESFQREQSQVMRTPGYRKHQSMPLRPLTFGAWMFDVVADLAGSKGSASPPLPTTFTSTHDSRALPMDKYTQVPDRQRRSSATYSPDIPFIKAPLQTHNFSGHRYSLPSTPTSLTLTANHHIPMVMDSDEFDKEKSTMERSAVTAREARSTRGGGLRRWANSREEVLNYIKVEKSVYGGFPSANGSDEEARPKFWALMRSIYPTIPRKPLLFFGLVICVLSGAMTPVFSYLLSHLLFEVSIGAQNVSVINTFGGLVLGVAAIDGFFLGLKYFVMETSGMLWVTHIRKSAFARILGQDKKWFDKPFHSPARLVQILVKDGDDARDLISVVWGQFFVVATMVGVGLVWAFVRGWQLTLAGLAIAPVFAITMVVQTKLVAKCEVRNKRAREDVARDYYDVRLELVLCFSHHLI